VVRIEVEDLPIRGRDVNVSLAEPWAIEATQVALDAVPTELSGHLHVSRHKGGEVQVVLQAHAAGPRSCDRCGAEVSLVVDAAETLAYLPDGARVPEQGEVALEDEDLDLGWYSGGVLDLRDVLTEALTLHLPTRVACADTAACDAAVAAAIRPVGEEVGKLAGHPAFAALKNLR
jgi:uncharacterized metal-binding protein YceD (DUF177 family)